jgi:hypothetical protein
MEKAASPSIKVTMLPRVLSLKKVRRCPAKSKTYGTWRLRSTDWEKTNSPPRGRNHVTQAPAGDGKRFAQSTDGNGPLPQRLQAAGKDVLAPVLDDLVIDFVGDQH